MSNIELSIVIPCFNEEKNIPLIVDSLKRPLENENIELILVDNGSIDNTRNEIKKFAKQNSKIKLVIIDKNIGYGFGVYSGLKAARGEFIGWNHADLQIDPNYLLLATKIIKKQKNPENIFIRGKRVGRKLSEKFFTWGMGLFCSLVLRTYLFDIAAQPSLFHKSFLEKMKNPPKDFAFDLYTYYLAKKKEFKIIRFPVKTKERIHGDSRWNSGFKSRIELIKRIIKFTINLNKNKNEIL